MSAAPELFHPVSCGCLPVAAALLAGRRWLFYALLPFWHLLRHMSCTDR